MFFFQSGLLFPCLASKDNRRGKKTKRQGTCIKAQKAQKSLCFWRSGCYTQSATFYTTQHCLIQNEQWRIVCVCIILEKCSFQNLSVQTHQFSCEGMCYVIHNFCSHLQPLKTNNCATVHFIQLWRINPTVTRRAQTAFLFF